MPKLSKAQQDFLDEPVGHGFIVQPDLYCGYCDELIEPEFWGGNAPCHLCGEWRMLYEKRGS